MGWNTNNGYYEKHVQEEGCSNVIYYEQKAFNGLSPNEIREGIQIAQQQYLRDQKSPNKDHTNGEKIKSPYYKTRHPIEYVVEENIDRDAR